ncbi:MAG: HAMP domain-containing histidine kinase [Clostridium sp.]|nr:HAMP domain-containing histidine kinase [Clostridium sp.]
MKKSTIWFLTVIMALTLTGLLYMQISYMKNMIRMREDQFTEGVRRSLWMVVSSLEQDETKHYLETDFSMLETSVLPKIEAPGIGGIDNSRTNSPELSLDRSAARYRSMQDVLRSQYLYQRGLLNEVILNILNQSRNRPVRERADSASVEHYLEEALSNNGLDIPFEFAVVSRNGTPFYQTAGYDQAAATRSEVYTQTLFPNDVQPRLNSLRIWFPTKKDYIYSSIRFMIPSFLFSFILLLMFIYTIVVAFRQKKLTEMKNDFINNMTHEFKTPISSISLAAQMLEDNSVRKSPAMLQHISTVINDETKRLRFQVEKVLQMSMFDRQRATLRLQVIDANVAIANITHTFKLKVEKYGGSIDAVLDAEDAEVNVDEMHFTNVIFNLLDNAVKYRREDVPLKLVVTSRDLPDRRLQITIEDNGIGIRKDDLKKIFEKFYRVPTGNRHDVKGFGLGLAYVRKMVGELGGEISVESELNVGTKFKIILPLTKN